MSSARFSKEEEVEQLLRNAQLRDELEPLCDESIQSVNTGRLPTPAVNEFLASMLAWEKAPMLPIGQWFEPELKLPDPNSLDEEQLREVLWQAIQKLFDKRIVLDFTDHLSDRDLYCVVCRDILPAWEKKLDQTERYMHFDCAGVSDDTETWLRYYASWEERLAYAMETGCALPEHEVPPYPRDIPQAPL